jgi:hypothetical protein
MISFTAPETINPILRNFLATPAASVGGTHGGQVGA